MKKLYLIEKKLSEKSGLNKDFALRCHWLDWHKWRAYETEKARDEALKAVENRDLWEYRKKDL